MTYGLLGVVRLTASLRQWDGELAIEKPDGIFAPVATNGTKFIQNDAFLNFRRFMVAFQYRHEVLFFGRLAHNDSPFLYCFKSTTSLGSDNCESTGD